MRAGSKRLFIVVIGQTPRPDVETLFGDTCHADEIHVSGALDGLTREEIAGHLSRDAGETLVTFLADDSTPVQVPKQLVESRAYRLFTNQPHGQGTRLLFCTGSFPSIEALGDVIVPSRLVRQVANAILPSGRLGIVVPHPDLIPVAEMRWRAIGRTATCIALAMNADIGARNEAVLRMHGARPNLIVLDCLSYDAQLREEFRQACDAPALLPIALLRDVAVVASFSNAQPHLVSPS